MSTATDGAATSVAAPAVNPTLAALETVEALYGKYVVFPSQEAADSVALWTLHAHVFTAFESTPRLSVSSTEPGSGKTRILEVLEQLVPNPLNAIYMTPGVMWRAIEHDHPTIILDEADTIFGKSGSGSAHRYLRAIINAGHRQGATVPRCVGTEDVKLFHVFAPVVLAGLGQLPETIAVRSIPIVMRRRRKGQEVEPFRMRYAAAELQKAREQLETWALGAATDLALTFPELPVKDRQADVWEPIITIAELAGGDWPARARRACVKLTEDARKAQPSVGVQLLTDLREVFGEREQMFTQDILAALHGMEDRDWNPDKLTSRTLARILSGYGVTPGTIRDGEQTAKGYKAASLKDPFERYLSS